MRQKFFIPGKLPDLNKIISASKRSKYAYARLKKLYTDLVCWSLLEAHIKKVGLAWLRFTWYEKTKTGRTRDPDNIAAGKKFILDALRLSKILKDDSGQYVIGWEDRFVYGKKQGVEVEIL